MKMALAGLVLVGMMLGGCAGTPVAVATYNVDNFFGDAGSIASKGDKEKSAVSLAALATVIHRVNADVLVLQEVQKGDALKEFNQTRLGDMGYSAVVVDEASDTRGLTLAVLSRYPVAKVVSHKDVPLDATLKGADAARESNHFARDLLRVDVKLPWGKSLTVYDLHLKSTGDFKDDPGSEKWRMREATRVTRIVVGETLHENIRNFIVAGDFNEPAESAVVQEIVRKSVPVLGTTPLSDVLEGVKPHDTFVTEKVKSAVDDIFLGPNLSGKGEVVDGEGFDLASSHRPVRVVLKL